MSAIILPFRRPAARQPVQDRRQALAGLSAQFGQHWTARHLPLVLAALDMLQADDRIFADRCRSIASEPGALARLVNQLARLAGHLHDVAEALTMVAQRIRSMPSHHREQPA